ncbi:hypothetical protein SAMN05443247_06996 [Bradyrhizobium erythrophlei]|nr:hypothetical protein SAMN05443247_06996 [Bradyrhizobium erythrophlei]
MDETERANRFWWTSPCRAGGSQGPLTWACPIG